MLKKKQLGMIHKSTHVNVHFQLVFVKTYEVRHFTLNIGESGLK